MITRERILKNCEGDRNLTIHDLGEALDIAEQFIRSLLPTAERDAVIKQLDEVYPDEVE